MREGRCKRGLALSFLYMLLHQAVVRGRKHQRRSYKPTNLATQLLKPQRKGPPRCPSPDQRSHFSQVVAIQGKHHIPHPAPIGPKQLLQTSRKQTIAFHNPFLSRFQLHPHREGPWALCRPGPTTVRLCAAHAGRFLHSNLERRNSVYCQTFVKGFPFRWPCP